jgi:hypothetical protein
VIRSQSGNLAETRPARGRYNTSRFGSHSGNACKLGRPEQQWPCYDTIMRREPTQRISTGPERSVQRNALRLDRQDAAILSVMSTFEPLLTLKLSVQVALLGEVTDRLVSVTCGLKDRHIQIRAYFSGGGLRRKTSNVFRSLVRKSLRIFPKATRLMRPLCP